MLLLSGDYSTGNQSVNSPTLRYQLTFWPITFNLQ
jgi:hypothetical protein